LGVQPENAPAIHRSQNTRIHCGILQDHLACELKGSCPDKTFFRKVFVVRIGLILPLMLLLFGGPDDAIAAAGKGNERPNLIYIMADDLGYGDLGCFGQARIKTPQLDQLAREGMKLTSYYAGNTVCRPSRLSLWTGLHAGHTAIDSNAKYVFQPSDVTVAELLQAAGYATGGVGKWAMGGAGTPGHPNRNGFDFWMGYLDQGNAHNYYPAHLWLNDQQFPLAGNTIGDFPQGRGRVASERTTYSHDVMTEQMLDFVRANHQRPFLLHVHWTIPHANNEAGRVRDHGMEVPDYGIYADRDWPEAEKGQAAMITRMDADVGRLVALLRELEIDQNTLIIFTSDNGPHSEGGHRHEFFDANGPLRGYKRDLYEGGIRVPTIAWWPGNIAKGATSDEPLAGYDWLPTACELAGLDPPKGIDGLSYLPTLLGNPQRSHEYLFWSFGPKKAVRKGRWKAVIPGREQALELYDLSEDIGEETDVAHTHPEIVAGMQGIIDVAPGRPRQVRCTTEQGTLYLNCMDAAKVLDYELEIVRPGELLTFCRVSSGGHCIPVRLSPENHRGKGWELMVSAPILQSALRFRIVREGEKCLLLPKEAAESTGTGEQVPAYNAQWGPGRGFRVGERVPDIPLVDLDGNEVRFSRFLGKRYILYCWASW
jgi:uncharacterized sulfatase